MTVPGVAFGLGVLCPAVCESCVCGTASSYTLSTWVALLWACKGCLVCVQGRGVACVLDWTSTGSRRYVSDAVFVGRCLQGACRRYERMPAYS
jgi:hypothetical protein